MTLFLTLTLGWLFPCAIAVMAASEDHRRLQLSNKHGLVLLIAWPFVVTAVPYLHVMSGFFAAVLVLVPGLLLFAMGVFSGGDIKLATAFALYLGTSWLAPFILHTFLLGGVLAVVALCVRHYASRLPIEQPPNHWIDRLRQGGRDLPYGIALSGAFIILMTTRFVYAYDFVTKQ